MDISAIRSAGQIPASSEGSRDTAAIDQKIRQLEQQLKQVKANRNLSAEEKQKRIENLEKQIERLRQQKENQSAKTPRQQTVQRDAPKRPCAYGFDVYA